MLVPFGSNENALRLEGDRCGSRRGAVQRFERSRLPDSVLSPEQQVGLTADRVAQVLELEPVRVAGLELDPLDATVPAELDDRMVAVPGIVQEERALAADRLELVALHERSAAVEGGDDVAGEAKRPGEDPVGPRRAVPRLAPDPLRLAPEQPRARDVVTTDVHQRAALHVGAEANVLAVVEPVREGRADQPELADRV